MTRNATTAISDANRCRRHIASTSVSPPSDSADTPAARRNTYWPANILRPVPITLTGKSGPPRAVFEKAMEVILAEHDRRAAMAPGPKRRRTDH